MIAPRLAPNVRKSSRRKSDTRLEQRSGRYVIPASRAISATLSARKTGMQIARTKLAQTQTTSSGRSHGARTRSMYQRSALRIDTSISVAPRTAPSGRNSRTARSDIRLTWRSGQEGAA